MELSAEVDNNHEVAGDRGKPDFDLSLATYYIYS